MRLMTTLDGVDQLVEAGQALPPFDCHCPLLSLPLAFRTDEASIPATTPYLVADLEAAREWRERIGCTQTRDARTRDRCLKVGLVWAGENRSHVAELRKIDARRSIAFERLAPLLDVPNVRFFSLQKGAAASQLSGSELGGRVVDYTQELHDFADTAALVANLDLVISVDTSTAHLAGALNKPVWILNRFDTCWRWLLERTRYAVVSGRAVVQAARIGRLGQRDASARDALAELSASRTAGV